MRTLTRKLIASLLIVSVAGMSLPLPAQAGMLDTTAVLTADGSSERQRIAALISRADVQVQLAARGVSPADVQARVAALTDEEAAQIAAHIDELPAGGILGVIIFVFLVLLVTDILGYTKIFPFTRPVQK